MNQQTPEQDRAFLAAPQRGDAVEQRRGEVGNFGHVVHAKVVGDERKPQANTAHRHQRKRHQCGHACALHQTVIIAVQAQRRKNRRVNAGGEGEIDGIVAEVS